MTNRLKQISLVCGIAIIMLAAFPVFGQMNAENEINKKPFQDFGKMILDRVEKKEIVLTENFLVEIEGELNSDGKFDLQKTKYVRSEGDTKMIEVAKDLTEAINDSGIFFYFNQLDMNKVNLILAQDDQQIYMILKSDLISEAKAKKISSGLYMAVSMGRTVIKDNDEKIILNNTNVSENGKTVIIKTSVEKSVGQEMIQRQLNKSIEWREKNRAN